MENGRLVALHIRKLYELMARKRMLSPSLGASWKLDLFIDGQSAVVCATLTDFAIEIFA